MAMKEAEADRAVPDMYVDFIIYALIFAIIRQGCIIFIFVGFLQRASKDVALKRGRTCHYGSIIGGAC